MRVTGIDLSLTSTGLVTAEDGNLTDWANPKTKGKRGDTLEQRQDRLYELANKVVAYGEESDLVVIEAPSYGSTGGSAHDRSGLWWLVVNAFMADDVPVAMVSPQGRAKYGSGKGNAKKDVVFAFVVELYQPIFTTIPNDDVADAVLLAAMGARFAEEPVEDWAPAEANLAAMGGVLWPVL